ncbi:MAG: class I SAM-dependent methyltransferase [Bacteroidales bacterium]|jgi:SAM-dependent methyltransferase|nr:class I SAM-dependent methyltransferase [Bacteroidales bacterium]
MQYDPIKRRLGNLFGKSTLSRRIFYCMLDILLLRSWHVRRMIRKMAHSLPADAAILDAGAGFGQYTRRIAGMNKSWKIDAVDLKEEQVKDCNAFFTRIGLADRVTFITGDLTLPGETGKYNLILSVDVMEHIVEDSLVFRNFLDALKPDGTLIISTPSDRGGSGVTHHDDNSFIDEHVRDGYNRDEITQRLRETGFSEVRADYTYGLPGSVAWHLAMKYPVKMVNLSGLFWIVLPLYYLIVMPFVLLLNLADLHITHRTGTGLIIRAVK